MSDTPLLLRTACLLLLLSLLAAGARADVANVEMVRAKEIVARNCYSCHGPTGLSSTTQFPKLAGQNVEYLTKQMFNFQSRARRSVVMEEQMAGLSGNDIEALASYFSRQQLVPDRISDRSLSEHGRSIYFSGIPRAGVSACASCHGPAARGAMMLPRLAGQHAIYLERQLQAFIERSRTNDRARMHIVARGLGAEDIKAVAYFLSGMP